MVADHSFAQGGQLVIGGTVTGAEAYLHRAAQILFARGLVLGGRRDEGGLGNGAVEVEDVAVVEEATGGLRRAVSGAWPCGTSTYGLDGGS